MHRRNQRSWPQIVGRLSSAPQSADKLNASAVTRRKIFRDAGVIMEMADYIERNNPDCDAASLLIIRNSAIGLRFAILKSVVPRPPAQPSRSF